MIPASEDAIRRGAFLTALKYLGIYFARVNPKLATLSSLLTELLASSGLEIREVLNAVIREAQATAEPPVRERQSIHEERTGLFEDYLVLDRPSISELWLPLARLALCRLVLDCCWSMSPFAAEPFQGLRKIWSRTNPFASRSPSAMQENPNMKRFSDGKIFLSECFAVQGHSHPIQVNAITLSMAPLTPGGAAVVLRSAQIGWSATQQALRNRSNFENHCFHPFLAVTSSERTGLSSVYRTDENGILIPVFENDLARTHDGMSSSMCFG
ncbi:MAG: hypothetical protein AAF550_03880 [Myxococcota bacterium]